MTEFRMDETDLNSMLEAAERRGAESSLRKAADWLSKNGYRSAVDVLRDRADRIAKGER